MASFVKVTYVDNETVIHAANLNAIQDSTLQNETDIDALESGKVDKVSGKGLSTNDFNNDAQSKLGNLPTAAELDTALAGKVPTTRKVAGKALSADVTLNAGDVGYSEETTYAEGTVGSEFAVMKTEIDEEYAKKDGSYESMTVGNAEQLVSTVGVEDRVPYTFRTSGGSADIGDRETDKIVGGTIAWNQLTQDGNFPNTDHWAASNGSISVNGNICTLTPNARYGRINQYFTYTPNHKLLIEADIKLSTSAGIDWQTKVLLSAYAIDTYANGTGSNSASATTEWQHLYAMCYATTSSATNRFMITDQRGSDWGTIQVKNYKAHDLTQMFGPTIANYIWTLESTTAGAGIAWFKKLFPKPYYSYNAGELMSVNTSAHKMTGFNQWDEQWELGYINDSTGENKAGSSWIRSKNYIAVIQNAIYYFKNGGISANADVYFYDANKQYLGRYTDGHQTLTGANQTFTIPSNGHFMRFYMADAYGTTYNHDICINLSWDGERDGEYEPYSTWSCPLDDSLTLRGIPKLDADNKLYYDGDTYESDGTVNRRYLAVDLGTLTWVKPSAEARFYATISPNYPMVENLVMICSKYQFDGLGNSSRGYYGGDKTIRYYYNSLATQREIYIHDETYLNDTAATFKAAMSGVYLVYELETPTTETADPYQNPQIVNDFGTEEYVDAGVTASTPTRDVAIPVGHETMYQANLRAKLEMAPDSPDGDGDYIVRQSSGQNTYVPITFPADELPAAPTSDGNYVLKCTVSSGTATFTWASA